MKYVYPCELFSVKESFQFFIMDLEKKHTPKININAYESLLAISEHALTVFDISRQSINCRKFLSNFPIARSPVLS